MTCCAGCILCVSILFMITYSIDVLDELEKHWNLVADYDYRHHTEPCVGLAHFPAYHINMTQVRANGIKTNPGTLKLTSSSRILTKDSRLTMEETCASIQRMGPQSSLHRLHNLSRLQLCGCCWQFDIKIDSLGCTTTG